MINEFPPEAQAASLFAPYGFENTINIWAISRSNYHCNSAAQKMCGMQKSIRFALKLLRITNVSPEEVCWRNFLTTCLTVINNL